MSCRPRWEADSGLYDQHSISVHTLRSRADRLQAKHQLQRANGLSDDLGQAERSRCQVAEDCRRLRSEAAQAHDLAAGLRAQLEQAKDQLQASRDQHAAGGLDLENRCFVLPCSTLVRSCTEPSDSAESQQAQTVAAALQQQLQSSRLDWQAKAESQHSSLRQQLQVQLAALQVLVPAGQDLITCSTFTKEPRLDTLSWCRISLPSRSKQMQL